MGMFCTNADGARKVEDLHCLAITSDNRRMTYGSAPASTEDQNADMPVVAPSWDYN
jgi:hypothetical protein